MRKAALVAAPVAAIIALIVATGATLVEDGAHARAAALTKVQRERPGVAWQIVSAQFYPVPYRVYDSRGQLREWQSGSPVNWPPPPRWVIEFRGQDAKNDYEALVDVSPVTDIVGSWGIASLARGSG